MDKGTLDLTSLQAAIVSLEEAMAVVSDESWFTRQDAAVRNTLISGVIQNFKMTYESCMKMIRRYMKHASASPLEADHSDFRDLLRTAVEKGLIMDIDAWFSYRKIRNITSHTYDHNKALQVYEGTSHFISDARALLAVLITRNV